MNEELYPLTEPQKNFLKIEQVNYSDNDLFSIYSYIKLPKATDINILDKVVNKIYELNDATRIHFIKDENTNEYAQYISDYSYEKTEIITYNTDSIIDVIEKIKQNKFSVNGLLNKFYIAKLPSYTYLIVTFHHILSDGYGMTNIANQIKDFYYAIENNISLDNYPVGSYKNFISREQEYLSSSRFEKDELFWKKQVQNIEPCTIFKNKDITSHEANRFEYQIPYEISDKIEKYCEKNKITEYSFFLSIISIYFNNMYNMENITLGTPYLNRAKKNDELLDTGLHVCTLPLNINFDINSDFITLCNAINSNNLSLYKHGGYSINNIQKLFREEKNTNANLYEIGFSYQIGISEKEFLSKNYIKNGKNDDIGKCAWIFSGSQNNTITFHITQINKQKVFSIDYLLSVFSEAEIAKTNSIIFNLINQILNGVKDFNKLQLLINEDVKLLTKFNSTGNMEKCTNNIIDIFEEVVSKHPNKTALICGNKELTYEEFNNHINYLAKYLIKNNIKKNTPIALLFDKSFDMLISIFAVLKIGCCYVPILPDENNKRINYIINDCSPSCILTHKNYENIVSDFQIKIFNIDNIFDYRYYSQCNNEKIQNPKQKINANDLANIIYTSGSTGNPKGVQVMHKNILGFIESMKKNNDLKPYISDVSMSLLKYSFDASGIDIYSSLLIGGSLLIVEKNDELNPIKVLELIEKYKVTRSFLIPKWIEHIVQTSLNYNFNITSLKLLGTGGEVLKPNLLKDFFEKYPEIKIANLYGPSETTMFSTYKIITNKEIEDNYSSIGTPIPGSRIAIINSNNMFLPINTEGELIVYEDNTSIENIAKGYLNLPDQTEKRYIQIFNPITKTLIRAYKTGDFAKINNNLEIEFIGRKDDIVKVNGGYLVALNEVEQKVNELLNNIESYAVAVPYKNTKAIVIFVKKDEKSISVNNIKKYLRENLSFYMQPKKIIELLEIPRNTSGKVDRKKLRDLALNELKLQHNNLVLPKHDIEVEIYNIIKDLIGTNEFSIIDDFFDDLGIDSLSLTTLAIALKKYNLNMQDFYTYSNIQDLSNFIENKHKSSCLNAEIANIENIKIKNNSKEFDLSTILLTGTTGFLGIHLLKELLTNKNVKKIYCIIRNKIGIEGHERLINNVNYYFNSDEKILNLISQKVVVLNGDISKPYFNLEKDVYSLLQKEVKTVVNSAANVKHFAKPEQIKNDNVISCDQIIDFCRDKISLAHISTLSIAGFNGKNTEQKIFNENTLYIKQKFNNNPYLISKFNAEIHILSAIEKYGLNAKIFRLGNIMPRVKDGKFQPNYKQNIFMNSFNYIFNLKTISQDMLDLKVEFSPVDECAKSIMNLLNSSGNNIYHIINNNTISIRTLIKYFEKNTGNFTITNHSKFIDCLEQISDEYVKEYILGTNLNKYSEKNTLKELQKYGFTWSITDENYINKIIEIINNF